jgi:hypothetical protein
LILNFINRFEPEFTKEELEEHSKIAREYHRQCMKRFNHFDKDLTDKIWLQQEALRAVPSHLLAHAKLIDQTPPPIGRPWPIFDTPPIKDFDIRKYVGRQDGEEEEGDAI